MSNIDPNIINDGDVLEILMSGVGSTNEKLISLTLSHKLNNGSILLTLSELKKLVEVMENE